MIRRTFLTKCLLIAVVGMLCSPVTSHAYSVLTHEAIIDAIWEKSIQPLLKQKYPGVTEEQLKVAHSYAYGGAIAPDMGYFPFGSHFFTNLVHYVRSGDLVDALLDEATDVNEYAFALGFLCHYMSDKYGHFLGTNRCVPLVYPKMKEKFGEVVTYEENRISHKRIEFAFDVLQTAKGNYATQAYHDFIGFNVSRPVLERAFLKTYGLELSDVCKNIPLAIETFRWSVMSLFPVITRIAWSMKKNDILKSQPTATSKNFGYKMNRANYKHQYGGKRKRPGFWAYSFSWLIIALPKIGPLRSLKIKEPGPEAEKIFIQSFDAVLLNCSSSMKLLNSANTRFVNIDFDTGKDTAPGEYKLADESYGKLVLELSEKKFEKVNPDLRLNIIQFYSHPDATISTKKGLGERKKINRAVEELESSKPNHIQYTFSGGLLSKK